MKKLVLSIVMVFLNIFLFSCSPDDVLSDSDPENLEIAEECCDEEGDIPPPPPPPPPTTPIEN